MQSEILVGRLNPSGKLVWRVDTDVANQGYPKVINYADWSTAGTITTDPPGGSGTAADPRIITTAEQLGWWGAKGGNYIRLGGDIDLLGSEYGGSERAPLNWGAGSAPVRLEGQGYQIDHIYVVSNTSSLGFFSSSNYSTITDLRISGTVLATKYIGGLIAVTKTRTIIRNVISDMRISGGIVGQWQTSGIIENCAYYGSGAEGGMIHSLWGTDVTIRTSLGA